MEYKIQRKSCCRLFVISCPVSPSLSFFFLDAPQSIKGQHIDCPRGLPPIINASLFCFNEHRLIQSALFCWPIPKLQSFFQQPLLSIKYLHIVSKTSPKLHWSSSLYFFQSQDNFGSQHATLDQSNGTQSNHCKIFSQEGLSTIKKSPPNGSHRLIVKLIQ